MSSATSATLSPDSLTGVTQPSSTADKEVLRVARGQPYFSNPFERGTWLHLPEFFTIRYRAVERNPRIDDAEIQKDATKAIWQRVAHLLPAGDMLAGPALGVIFDMELWSQTAIIDVVCSTQTVCEAICEELSVIVVQGRLAAHGWTTYARHSWSNSPFLDVMPLDVFDAAVEGREVDKFIEKLSHHTARLGTLFGPIRTMITSRNSKEPLKLETAIRVYVKLSPNVMQLPSRNKSWDRVASHLDWKDNPSVSTSLRHLQFWKPQTSAIASEGGAAGGEGDPSEAGTGSSTHGAAKKRKSGEE